MDFEELEPFVLVTSEGKRYLPILGLQTIVERALKVALTLSEKDKVPIEDIGIDLDKFHTLNISPDGDLRIDLVKKDE